MFNKWHPKVRFTPNGIKYYLLVIWLSLKWVFRVNLGDVVLYRGNKYVVFNGVMSKSWRIDIDNGRDGWVPRSECRKHITFANLHNSFKSGYHFYMTNWYVIWANDGVKPWMLGCKIWANH